MVAATIEAHTAATAPITAATPVISAESGTSRMTAAPLRTTTGLTTARLRRAETAHTSTRNSPTGVATA
jgi:hypothetical protein